MGKKWLNIVYGEKNSARLKNHYREWADGYDSDLKDWGYAYPSKVKQILKKYITLKKSSKILDAGCGTGYVAEVLKVLRYNNIVGIDYSKDMLRVARSKKIYKKLVCESLSKKTSLKGNQFDLIICTGVLTSGHVGPVAIKELIRLTKNKSYLILSISEAIYEKLGFKKEIEKRSDEISKIYISKPFIALPNHKSSARSRMYLFQKI
jgi:predicted TPR repeat methyltransferase